MQELNVKERGKLETALKEFLDGDQTTQAVASLGTFNRQWDRYVDVLAGFRLGDEKQTSALTLVNKFVIDSDAARSEAIANMDFQSLRTTSQELKSKLDSALAGTLSEEQLAKWKEVTAFRGRGGPGGGRRPGGRLGPEGRQGPRPRQ